MKSKKLRLMCVAGVFTAIVFVFTAYLHVPSGAGYTHVGDGFIYLAACMLPRPYAIFVGAGGAMLSDLLTGYAMWAPGSVIIKTAAVLFFSFRSNKIINARNMIALIPASILCIGGYYLYHSIITLNLISPMADIPGYVTQSVLSGAVFIFIGAALDKLKMKERMGLGGDI